MIFNFFSIIYFMSLFMTCLFFHSWNLQKKRWTSGREVKTRDRKWWGTVSRSNRDAAPPLPHVRACQWKLERGWLLQLLTSPLKINLNEVKKRSNYGKFIVWYELQNHIIYIHIYTRTHEISFAYILFEEDLWYIVDSGV